MQGNLIIVSAPSGGGKTSLVDALIKQDQNISVSVSHTTRSRREGERHSEDYYFVTENEFENMRQRGEFLEYATVFGRHYGTTRAWVAKTIENGRDVILEIDWQGAESIKRLMPESVGIFILPPSLQILYQRLKSRGQDNEEVIEKRMAAARDEMRHYVNYDYVIVNDVFNDALLHLQEIIAAQRLTCRAQKIRHRVLIEQLLK